MMKRHVDLCAGLGAMTLALREHGYTTVMACDISEHCHKTYVANHGNGAVWEPDVFGIRELPPCEVLTAGAPCQSFSYAGKRAGFSCPTNGGVFAQVLDLINKAPSRPGIVIFENVMGLQSIEGGRCLLEIEGNLRSLGYVVKTQRVDAEHWGSPTTRSRLFVVGRLEAQFGGQEEALLPPFPEPPMTRGRVGDHLDPPEDEGQQQQVWMHPEEYTILPEQEWHIGNSGKVFVGYLNGRKLKGNGDPRCPGTHSQSSRIYHADGVYECITQHRYPVYCPDPNGGEGGRVRKMSVREVGSMMGLPRGFLHHELTSHARQMVANTINMYALRPLVAWALQHHPE
jgi:DNA-cytosine methyltransferase